MSPTAIYILMAAILTHVFTHLLIPANIRFSQKMGIVALPNARRIHKEATPEGGGLSFALPILLFQALMGIFVFEGTTSLMLLQLAALGLLCLVVGIIDDRYESRAAFKFISQVGIALLMYYIGFRVEYLTNPLGMDFTLGWLSLPITLLWHLAVLNAINLIDGMDGLATGITMIVCAVLLVVGMLEGNTPVILLAGLLLAGSSAFLVYNFHPARLFLGETGALFIGLNIAAISTVGSEQFKGITSITLIIPLAALAVPLIDMALAVSRRIGGGNIFVADKAHIHHIMLAFGLSQKAISIIAYIVTLLFGLIAIGFSFSSKKILFSLLLVILVLVVVAAYIFMRREREK
ncbi:MAG: undecaprenyl/decaprenyl-phosphate alpha-N-acetylglucosaminyl 1-phosphate transferase [Candidatus Cloacimonetes bacterium]|nr:undecaprenyl/decaprenyl-phosphate alpha-N-acetylglucosaminyl 1-phosphate transferase [Candidatus Cloacimonadota bacterium]